jgi:two-component system, response regulator RegA
MAARKVLIVEDDTEMRRGLRLLLADAGYQVVAAEGVQAALAAFPDTAPDLALLDHSLSDGTAFDLLKAFAAIDGRVPSVILTGTADAGLADALARCGARAFLTKPARPEHLLATLASLLDGPVR